MGLELPVCRGDRREGIKRVGVEGIGREVDGLDWLRRLEMLGIWFWGILGGLGWKWWTCGVSQSRL